MPRDQRPFDPSQPDSIEMLQIVFKVVERCNINCTYCYYFNMGETSAMGRPARVNLATTRMLADWIATGCRELRIPKVSIAFHGGEPMMLRPSEFQAICRLFLERVGPTAELSFAMQTNGLLLSDIWLSLLEEYGVRVGVSIDGYRAAHDRFRLDRRGRSTFDGTEQALKRLVEWAHGNPEIMPSTISVLDPRNDYGAVYSYLRGLGVEQMHFLLPDRNADSPIAEADGSGRQYGKALYEIFEAWLIEDNPAIHIRYIRRVLDYFQLRQADMDGPRRACKSGRSKKKCQVIVARSDGTVAIDDSYIPALSWYSKNPVYSTSTSTLREFLADKAIQDIERLTLSLPSACAACKWRRICGGGDLENRFSEANLFDNPSVYCEGYKVFYEGLCAALISNGYPAEAVRNCLGVN